MLRRDYDGDYVIDIENRMERKSLRMKMVRDIKKLAEDKRILIRYAQTSSKDFEEVYEVENRADLMVAIK